ncbi:MAG: GCN5-related N-acetyltransferase, partial [Gammaproteobacteria bacterium]|nr:GCN5-related N-acetyltransferase [Gammaproteobacteria bacterium]
RQVLVAEDRSKILGFAEYEPSGHIDCFYVHHEHQHRGVGKALMQQIEMELQKLNVHRLYAEVSVSARAFFEGRGYTVVEERNAEYQDVSLKLYLMEKYI